MSIIQAEKRRELPDEPGVYLFRNARGKVLYVGKAKSIRKRVASHFTNPSTRGGKTLTDDIDHVEALVVHTEAEALLAEQNFIKQYKPRFNIRLRADKSYPYIAISLDEDFPRVYFTRERQRVANEAVGTLDAIAVAVADSEANAQVFQVRDGVLSDRQSFYLDNEAGGGVAEVAEAFILQYYASAMMIPPLLIVQRELGPAPALAQALAERRGGHVEIRASERGAKRRILELAERTAKLALDQQKLRSERRRQPR